MNLGLLQQQACHFVAATWEGKTRVEDYSTRLRKSRVALGETWEECIGSSRACIW